MLSLCAKYHRHGGDAGAAGDGGCVRGRVHGSRTPGAPGGHARISHRPRPPRAGARLARLVREGSHWQRQRRKAMATTKAAAKTVTTKGAKGAKGERGRVAPDVPSLFRLHVEGGDLDQAEM